MSSLKQCFSLALIVAAGFGYSAKAYASTVTFGAVSSFPLVPSADSLSLSAASETVSAPGTASQPGDFDIEYSSFDYDNVSFTFNDSVTVNGVSQVLTFSGVDYVTPSQDTLEIYALGPVSFGDEVLTFGGVYLTSSTIGANDFSLNATVSAIPEPSSIFLLGMGMLSVAGMARRRFLRS